MIVCKIQPSLYAVICIWIYLLLVGLELHDTESVENLQSFSVCCKSGNSSVANAVQLFLLPNIQFLNKYALSGMLYNCATSDAFACGIIVTCMMVWVELYFLYTSTGS